MSEVSHEVVRLQRLLHRIRTELGSSAPAGADWTAYVLLNRLVEQPRRAGELADCVHSDPSTVSRQVRPLVDAGLVERVPDPDDGRAHLLAPTTAGRDLHRRMSRERDRFFDTVLEGWTAQDRETLSGLLGRLNDDLERTRARLSTPTTTGDRR